MEKNENKILSRRQRKKFSTQLQEVFELNWYCVPPHQFSVAEARWRAPDHCLHAVPLITSWPVKTESSDPFRIFFFFPPALCCTGCGRPVLPVWESALPEMMIILILLRGQCGCWHQRLQSWCSRMLCLRSRPPICFAITRWIVFPLFSDSNAIIYLFISVLLICAVVLLCTGDRFKITAFTENKVHISVFNCTLTFEITLFFFLSYSSLN